MKEFLIKLITMNNDIDEKILVGLYFCLFLSLVIIICLFRFTDTKIITTILYILSGIICGAFGISAAHQISRHKKK